MCPCKVGSCENLEKLFQVKSYQESEQHTKNQKEFFKMETNFISLLQKSPLFFEKYKNDLLRQEEENTGGLVSKVLELPLFESQIEVSLMLKLQKMILVLEKILKSLETGLVTQYTLKEPFQQLARLACDSLVYELAFKIMFFEVDCLMTLNDYHSASKLLKPISIVADLFWDYKLQKRAYLNMGHCAKYLGDYKQAKNYYEKFLHMSWFSKDSISELKAYDLIGMAFYYQNNLEMAQRYHQRSLNPDSALEDKEFHALVESKLRDEDARRSRLLTLRPVFFRHEIMRDFLTYEGEIDPMLTIRDLHQYMSSPFTVENLSLKSSPTESSQNTNAYGKSQIKGLQLRIKPILGITNYSADFSPEGYINAMLHSNPAVYQLIQDGKFKLDNGNIKGVNLYDKTYSNVEDPKLLSHMSPNNSKATFMMASKDSPEICLEFLKRHSKERVQGMVAGLKDQLLEYVAWICRPRGEIREESVSVPYVSLMTSASARVLPIKKIKLPSGALNKNKIPSSLVSLQTKKTGAELSTSRFSEHLPAVSSGRKKGETSAGTLISPSIKRIGEARMHTEGRPLKLAGSGNYSSRKVGKLGKITLPMVLSPIAMSPVHAKG